MPTTAGKKSELIEGYLTMIEERGGVPALIERMDEYHQCVDRMMRERDALMRKHPDKWVVMGKDGVLSVGDTLDQVLEDVEDRRRRGVQVMVDFLDTNPPELIL